MARKKKSEVFKTALVEKRNILNEIRNNGMSLQEKRFFSIYLSKINARDISTRVVTFPINDFQKIMGLQTLNYAQIRGNFKHLLQQVVSVPNENGRGFTSFQLFKRCKLLQEDKTGEWIVEIDAHDDALPLMFEYKKNYFTYELWNALSLKSSNQIVMYEILKQYEKIGHRELTVADLRALLGIAPNEYPRWDNFKRKILDSCQQALKENTDICFTYEKGRSGRGGAWLSIVFHIFKNTEYVDQLTLSEFIDLQAIGSDVADLNVCEVTEIIDVEYIALTSDDETDKPERVPDEPKPVKQAKTVSEKKKTAETAEIEQITAEVDERIDYEGMKKLEEALGSEYEDEKLDLLGTIRNIIIQVIAGYIPVRVNRQMIPKEYAKEIFSQIDRNDVSNVMTKFLEYPTDVAMPQVLLATMLFNEVSSRGTNKAGIARERNEATKTSDIQSDPSFDLEALFEHAKNTTPKLGD